MRECMYVFICVFVCMHSLMCVCMYVYYKLKGSSYLATLLDHFLLSSFALHMQTAKAPSSSLGCTTKINIFLTGSEIASLTPLIQSFLSSIPHALFCFQNPMTGWVSGKSFVVRELFC